VANGSDALQYIVAGASLVGIGTAALRDPRAPMRVVKEMAAWCDAHGVARISDLVGTLEGLT
jgi:dihydroorotate dehydrogenase (NAD+) catalytic subunit